MIDVEKYRKMLDGIAPKYAGESFTLDDCPVPLTGESIKRHLHGFTSVLIFAVTLGEDFDRLLRQFQLTDMAGAVVLDSLAGEALEDFLNNKIGKNRFSPGYGDFPLEVNRDIVETLHASKRIGLCVTDDFILTPQKSITGIAGIK